MYGPLVCDSLAVLAAVADLASPPPAAIRRAEDPCTESSSSAAEHSSSGSGTARVLLPTARHGNRIGYVI